MIIRASEFYEKYALRNPRGEEAELELKSVVGAMTVDIDTSHASRPVRVTSLSKGFMTRLMSLEPVEKKAFVTSFVDEAIEAQKNGSLFCFVDDYDKGGAALLFSFIETPTTRLLHVSNR